MKNNEIITENLKITENDKSDLSELSIPDDFEIITEQSHKKLLRIY